MASPQVVTADPDCPAPELPLRPVGKQITTIRVSGNPDLLQRDKNDGFTFVTIPPVGQDYVEVVFELPPENLMQRLGKDEQSVQEKLLHYPRPGDVYKIVPRDLSIRWWAFGSLDDETSLKGKKIARWTLPNELALDRGPGEDETEEVARKLKDLVNPHNVNSPSSRSAAEGEQIPNIRQTRPDGWVFGEPEAGLVIITTAEDRTATFRVVE